MEDITRQVKSLKKELIIKGIGKISHQDLINLAYKGFSPYFEHPINLKKHLERGTLVYDYVFFHNNFKDSIFENFLFTLLTFFHKAKIKNDMICYSFYADWHQHISSGIRNTATAAHIERNKEIARLDIFSKVCFQEIGDFIEGSFQPFLKLLLGLYYIQKRKNKNIVNSVMNKNLGNTVNTLINAHEDLAILYKHILQNIPLNQWRNIANHNSYEINSKNTEIICEYGKFPDKHKVRLNRKKLHQTCIAIHHIYYLHKIADTIFFCDNYNSLKNFFSYHEYTEDTIIAAMIEIFFIHGFEVISVKKESDIWLCSIKDYEDRNMEVLVNSLNNAINLINSFKTKPLELYISNSVTAKLLKAFIEN